jgi:transketolase
LDSVCHTGAGNLGGSLSAVELLVALYFHALRIDPTNPLEADRDRFILSKGHAAIGLYTVLALRGYFPKEELKTYGALDSRLQDHPNMSRLPCVDMSVGSLGQGLAPALGMALGAKIRGKEFLTYVLLGDRECQDGQVWEAAMLASRYRLDNLIGLLDCNRLQQYGWAGTRGYKSPDRNPPIDQPRAKWEAFGWYVLEIDGHSFSDILSALSTTRQVRGRPTMIVARTIKGKGISFMQSNYRWHFRIPTAEEQQIAQAELAAEAERL